MKKLLLAAMVAFSLAASTAGATQTSTLTMETALPVHYQDTVEFTADSNIPNLLVRVLCYQAGELVYGEATTSIGYGPAHVDEFYVTLGGNPDRGSIWAQRGGGPADCQADLYYFKNGKTVTAVYLDSLEFPAT